MSTSKITALKDAFKTRKKLLGELSVTLSSVGLATCFSFASTKIMSTSLSKEQFSVVVLAFTVQAFFNLFLYGPYLNAVGRYFHEFDPRDKFSIQNISQNLAGLFLRLSVAVGLTIIGTYLLIPSILGVTSTAIVFGLLLASIQGYFDIYTNFYLAQRQRIQVLLSQVFLSMTKLFACIPLMFSGLQSGTSVLVVLFFSSVLITKWQRDRTQLHFPKTKVPLGEICRSDTLKRAMAYAVPFVGWSLSQWFFSASDKWTLQYINRSDLISDLAVISTIFVAPFNIVASSIQSFLMPIFYQKISSPKLSTRYFIKRTFAACLLFLAISVPFLTLYKFKPEFLLALLSDTKYISVSSSVFFFSIAAVLLNTGQLLCSPLLLENRLKKLALLKNSSMVVGSFLVFFAALRADLAGIATSQIYTGVYFSIIAIIMICRLRASDILRRHD